jgi:predicted nucleic-acid-binding protein
MRLIDANVALRYILNDHEALAKAAHEVIDNERVMLRIEVAAEVIYVLSDVYQVNRKDTADTLQDFLDSDHVTSNHPDALIAALRFYADTRLDFIDCVLLAFHIVEGWNVVTFDKKLGKLL